MVSPFLDLDDKPNAELSREPRRLSACG
jgi:hypothetical protein